MRSSSRAEDNAAEDNAAEDNAAEDNAAGDDAVVLSLHSKFIMLIST